MGTHTTTNYSWIIPDDLSENNVWGAELVTAFNDIDVDVNAVSIVAAAALPKAGGTMTGAVVSKVDGQTTYAKGDISGAVTFDLSNGQFITCRVTGAVTSVTFSNLPASATPVILKIENGQSSGAWVWGSAYKWTGGVQPVLTTSGFDILGLVTFNTGTRWDQAGISLANS